MVLWKNTIATTKCAFSNGKKLLKMIQHGKLLGGNDDQPWEFGVIS
jgi:hypothetical protein